MSILKSRLKENNVRFSGKVLDVGARDGRNFSLIKELGAERIYGVDPENKEFAQAMASGFVRSEDLIHGSVEKLAPYYDKYFDFAVIFQISPLLRNSETFFKNVRRILNPEGTLIYTVSENELANPFDARFIETGFRIIKQIMLNGTMLDTSSPYATRLSLEKHSGNCSCFDPFGRNCSLGKYLEKNYTFPNQNIRIAQLDS